MLAQTFQKLNVAFEDGDDRVRIQQIPQSK
jgi:hypothetical protein